jgi:hypothetical protein
MEIQTLSGHWPSRQNELLRSGFHDVSLKPEHARRYIWTLIFWFNITPNSGRMADSDHFSHKYWRSFVDHSCSGVRPPWPAPTLESRPPGLKRTQPSFQFSVLLSAPLPIRSDLIKNMRSPDGAGPVSYQISSPKQTAFCTVQFEIALTETFFSSAPTWMKMTRSIRNYNLTSGKLGDNEE